MTLPTKVNGSRSKTPQPRPVVRIVDYVRKNGFEEKAALIEDTPTGATLRIFGASGTMIVKDVPNWPVKKRGHWTAQSTKKGRVA